MLITGDNVLNWKDYTLNGVSFTIVLNTKKHKWQVYFGAPKEKPDKEFTQAKGDAVVKFLELLEEQALPEEEVMMDVKV